MSAFAHAVRRYFGRAFRRRAVPSLFVALFTATAAACKSDSPSGPGGNGSIVGSYNLDEVDGKALPVTIFDGDVQTEDGQIARVRVDVTDGSIDLDDGEEFSGALALRITVQGQPQTELIDLSGEYSRSGSAISFEPQDNDFPSFEGTVRNGRLELEIDLFEINEPFIFTFRK